MQPGIDCIYYYSKKVRTFFITIKSILNEKRIITALLIITTLSRMLSGKKPS